MASLQVISGLGQAKKSKILQKNDLCEQKSKSHKKNNVSHQSCFLGKGWLYHKTWKGLMFAHLHYSICTSAHTATMQGMQYLMLHSMPLLR